MSDAYPFVKYSDFQLAYERGEGREFQWQAILNAVEGSHSHFRELVHLASEEPALRRLFPQIGHRFALSENEYSQHLLFWAFVIRPEWYRIHTKNGDGFVEGSELFRVTR